MSLDREGVHWMTNRQKDEDDLLFGSYDCTRFCDFLRAWSAYFLESEVEGVLEHDQLSLVLRGVQHHRGA